MKWVACEGCCRDKGVTELVPAEDVEMHSDAIAQPYILSEDNAMPKHMRWRYLVMGELAICQHLRVYVPRTQAGWEGHHVIVRVKPFQSLWRERLKVQRPEFHPDDLGRRRQR